MTEDGATSRLSRFGARLLVPGLIVLGFYCYGLGSGGTFYFKLVKAPFAAASDAPYYRASLLHVAVGHMLGLAGSILTFRVAVLACFWGGLVVLRRAIARVLSGRDVALVLAVALLHPSAMIVYAWTCHPDALTYLLTAILMFARRWWVVGIVAVLGAWTHLAMWVIICGNVALLWLAFAEADARRRVSAVAVGVLIGAVSLKLTLWGCGIVIGSDRLATAVAQDLDVLMGYWRGAGWAGVYSLYFAHLLWVPVLVGRLFAVRRAVAVAFLATQAVALAAAFVTEDTTRVFALLAWGPLLYCLVRVLGARETAGWRDRVLRPLICVALLVSLVGPKIFAWKGDVRSTEGARAQLRGLLF